MDNRKEYAYLLCVGGKILKIIANGGALRRK